jgi:hypothetical protein
LTSSSFISPDHITNEYFMTYENTIFCYLYIYIYIYISVSVCVCVEIVRDIEVLLSKAILYILTILYIGIRGYGGSDIRTVVMCAIPITFLFLTDVIMSIHSYFIFATYALCISFSILRLSPPSKVISYTP